jgi:hypothetical protein
MSYHKPQTVQACEATNLDPAAINIHLAKVCRRYGTQIGLGTRMGSAERTEQSDGGGSSH